jgi:ABC-2 type transport system permease protein
MIAIIASQELRLLFRSPLAWIVSAIMQLVFAWLFLSSLEHFLSIQAKLALRDNAPGVTAFLVSQYMAPAAIVMMLISPLLSMHSIAEQKRSGAFVLLRVSPVSFQAVVLGKFIAIFSLQLLLLALAFLMPLSLLFFTAIDLGRLFSAFLGLALFSAACTSVSLYCSAINKQPILAAFSGFAVLLLLWLIGTGSHTSEVSSQLLQNISLPWHLSSFFRGLLDTRDLLYYLLFSALFLSLTVIKLDSLRHTEHQ